MDPSPRDRNQNTCVKEGLSELDERLTLRYMASRGTPDRHQVKYIIEAVDHDQMAKIKPDGRSSGEDTWTHLN